MALLFFVSSAAEAAPVIAIDPEPVTWNIIGLDNSNVLEGPEDFPVGIRVRNNGDAESTSVTVTLALTGSTPSVPGNPSPYVDIAYSDVASTTSIAPGDYADLYFTVKLTRVLAAVGTLQNYSLTITGDDIAVPLVSNDTLKIESITGQQSNDILSLVGPELVQKGEVREFILDAKTQNGGRAQVEQFVNFPNTIFQVLNVETKYTYPAPGVSIDKFYADACGWDRVVNTCSGPAFPTGSTVGENITTTYTVFILETPSEPMTLTPLIMDTSNAKNFHYNTDFGLNVLVLKPKVDLAVVKTAVDAQVEAGDFASYILSVVNTDLSSTATDVVLTDVLPAGLTFVSSVPPPTSGPNPLRWEFPEIDPETTLTVSLITQTSCATTGTLSNTAEVTATTRDLNTSNNMSTQTITVLDTTAPVINCPAEVTASSDPGQCASATVAFTVTATDNCSAVTVKSVPASGSVFPLGETTVNSTATDASGNQSFCSFKVIVTDAQAPVISCPPTIEINSDEGLCSVADAGVTTPTATDNCAPIDVTGTRDDGLALDEPYPVGTTTIVWEATDVADTVTSCPQLVIVHDATNPVITCPGNMTIQAAEGTCEGTVADFTVTATDNCSTVTVTTIPEAGTALPVGDNIIEATATDAAGNISTCEFTVTVQDNQLPVITCPATISVTADAVGCQSTSVNVVAPSGSDNCGIDTVVGVRSDSLALTDPYPVGSTIITWTATDIHGNTAECPQTVTVADTTKPTITCLPPVEVDADAQSCEVSSIVLVEPVTSDNCSTETVIGVRSDAGLLTDPFPVGETVVTWTVSDASGNETSCTQTITVNDVTAPSIECPGAINVTASADNCSAAGVVVAEPTVISDNCSTWTIAGVRSDSAALTDPYPVGTTTITWTATDSAGNTDQCTQDVVVTDEVDPVITCPATISVTADAIGCQSTGVNVVTPPASDNCGVDTVVGVRSDALALTDPYPVGSTIITWTVTDIHGNTAECQQTVTVADTTKPTITCLPSVEVDADALACEVGTITLVEPVTSDNCSTETVNGVRSDAKLLTDPFPVGETVVTWTVSDASGNETSCTQTITVNDVTAPSIECPGAINVTASADDCSAAGVAVAEPTVISDNCSTWTIAGVRSDSAALTDPYPVGTTTITWTATDSAGNTDQCTQNVVVTDEVDPVITCPATISVTADAIGCQSTGVNVVTPPASDNCGVDTVVGVRSDALALTDPYPVGSTIITWTVTDIHGNTAECQQTVTVADTTKPTITCLPSVEVDADALACEVGTITLVEPVTSDNCSTETVNGVRSDAGLLTDPFPVGETVVTWTVSDASGNETSCTQTITVNDVTAPVITCPTDINVSNTSGTCGAIVSFNPTAVDSCGGDVTVVADPPSGSAFPSGPTTVNVTATDAAGNEARCSFTVTVNDTEDPTITCPPDVFSCTQIIDDLGTYTLSDNCSSPTVVITRSDNLALTDEFPIGVTVVTYTATDDAGNIGICQQNVTVAESALPAVGCPDDIIVNTAEGECVSAAIIYPAVNAMDDCSTDTSHLTITYVPPSGSTFPIGETTVTVTVKDPEDHQASCTFKVIVQDATAPTIACPADITVDNTPGKCGSDSVTFTLPTAQDCSGPVTVVADPPSGSAFPSGPTTVNVTATDTAGNIARCSFTVTVNDTEDPTITCPATVNATANVNCVATDVTVGTPTVSDNCTAQPNVFGVRSDSKPLTDPYPIGTTTITWTVFDGAENSATCDQLVVVTDSSVPTIACPSDITIPVVEGTCLTAPVQYPVPTVSDNCSAGQDLLVTYNPASGTTFAPGEHTIIVTATDNAGNEATCSFKVIVPDTTAPTIACPANITVDNTPGKCGSDSVTFTLPTAQDCSGPVTVVADPASGSAFPSGPTTVNVTATDTAGNIARCSFTVTVNDTEKPAITCPATVNVAANVNCQATNVTLGTPVVTDNCSVPTVAGVRSDSKPLTDPYPIGTTTVTWTVTDAADNTATCDQLVVITDSSVPTIACPSDITIPVVEGTCLTAPVQYPVPTVSDNCSAGQDLLVTYNPASGTTFAPGEHTIIVTATDNAGNEATCSFKVIVPDTTAPTIACPANITVDNTPGKCGSDSVTFTLPTAQDCSGPVTVVADPASGSAFPSGPTTVNVTATDTAGNIARCSFTVTVNDTEKPAITCPATVNVAANVICQATNVTLGTPVVTDNCSVPTVAGVRSDSKPLTDPYPIGTTTVTWTVTDAADNTATCDQLVVVTDSSVPTIACPVDMNLALTEGTCLTAPVQYGAPVASDNCSAGENITVEYNPPSGTQFTVGQHVVTVTATDAAGNKAECTFNVNVNDTAPPVITCPGTIVVGNSAGQCGATSVEFTVTATDNCSNPVTVVTDHASGSAFPVGTTLVTATATDDAGNQATCSFSVVVNDTQAPALTCPVSMVVSTTDAECQATNVIYEASATDSCDGAVAVVFNPPSGSNFPVGVHTVQVSATDAAGNVATCSFTVTVEDHSAPRIQCPDTLVVPTAPCELTATFNLIAPETLDQCGQVFLTASRSDGLPATDPWPAGDTIVTWTATDASGNFSMCTQTVTVVATQCQPICDGPDLIIGAVVGPDAQNKGKILTVDGYWCVTNVGTQPSGETEVWFYLSDDPFIDASDCRFKFDKKRHVVRSLDPGEGVAIELKGKVPGCVDVGKKYILAVVDFQNVVAECNEDNNLAADHPNEIPDPKAAKKAAKAAAKAAKKAAKEAAKAAKAAAKAAQKAAN